MNPYTVLGLPPNASAEDIRNAYRRHALELHPDRSGGSSQPFLELQEAYGMLSDPRRRSAFDRRSSWCAEPRPTEAPAPEPLCPVEPVTRFETRELFEAFDSYAPSLEEMLERWMGNLSVSARPKSEGVESLAVDVPLSKDQAMAGGAVVLGVPARTPCRSCAAHGAVGRYLCWRCGGTGWLTGEVPVRVAYPPGVPDLYVVCLPLEALGIQNFFLTVRFRRSDEEAW